MRFLNSLAALVKPRKAQFIKTLIAWRKEHASEYLLSRMAPMGSVQGKLWTLGLESIEHVAIPETTVATVLEHYWEIRWLYERASDLPRYASDDEKLAEREERHQKMFHQLEYLTTGKVGAEHSVPQKIDLSGYLRYRVQQEHPYHNLDHYGITQEFLNHAIEQSKYVFGKT